MSPADPRWIVLAILTVLVSNQISLTCAIASSEMTVLSWIAGWILPLNRCLTALERSNFSGAVLPPQWNLSTVSSACETWSGVYCSQDGFIELLVLDQFIAQGRQLIPYNSTIPAAIGLLPKLYYLGLRRGSFYGEIPPEIFTPTLERLELFGNSLSGALPRTVGNARRLKYLGLSYNMITSLPKEELKSRLNNSLTDLALERNPLGCDSFVDELLETYSSPMRHFACDKSHLMFSPDSAGRICGSSKWHVTSSFPLCPVRPWVSGIAPQGEKSFEISTLFVFIKVQGSRITFHGKDAAGNPRTNEWIAWDFYGLSVYSAKYLEDEATFEAFNSVREVANNTFVIEANFWQKKTNSSVGFSITTQEAVDGILSLFVQFNGLRMPASARTSSSRQFGLPMQILVKSPITNNTIECQTVEYTESLLTGVSTGCRSKLHTLSWDPTPTGTALRFRSTISNFSLELPLLYRSKWDSAALSLTSKEPKFYLLPDGDVWAYSSSAQPRKEIVSSLNDQALAILFEYTGTFTTDFIWNASVDCHSAIPNVPIDGPVQSPTRTLPVLLASTPNPASQFTTTGDPSNFSSSQPSAQMIVIIVSIAAGTLLITGVAVATVPPLRRRLFCLQTSGKSLRAILDLENVPRATESMSTVPLTSASSDSRSSSIVSLDSPSSSLSSRDRGQDSPSTSVSSNVSLDSARTPSLSSVPLIPQSPASTAAEPRTKQPSGGKVSLLKALAQKKRAQNLQQAFADKQNHFNRPKSESESVRE